MEKNNHFELLLLQNNKALAVCNIEVSSFLVFLFNLQVLLLSLQSLLLNLKQHMFQKYIMVGKSFVMFFFRLI
jgi:hypothetical protein